MSQTTPRWDLSNIYKGIDDPQLSTDMTDVSKEIQELTAYFEHELLPLVETKLSAEEVSSRLSYLVDKLNLIFTNAGTIGAFLSGIITTDSYDKKAEQLQSQYRISMLPLRNLEVRVSAWLGKMSDQLPDALEVPGTAKDHAFALLEDAQQSKFLMSEIEEELANELSCLVVPPGASCRAR